MFTGIIEARGTIVRITPVGQDLTLMIDVGHLSLEGVQLGDSIAVNGVCLTVVRLHANSFEADVSVESLANTCIGQFKSGQSVNLEKALTLSTRLGGHLVSGHVDGVGEILSLSKDGRSHRFEVSAPESLHKYIAAKGSITVDGASLTVTGVSEKGFFLNIVPHTMENTVIPEYKVGSRVHIEVDLIARYAERLLSCTAQNDAPAKASNKGLNKEFLFQHGFGGRR